MEPQLQLLTLVSTCHFPSFIANQCLHVHLLHHIFEVIMFVNKLSYTNVTSLKTICTRVNRCVNSCLQVSLNADKKQARIHDYFFCKDVRFFIFILKLFSYIKAMKQKEFNFFLKY